MRETYTTKMKTEEQKVFFVVKNSYTTGDAKF